MTLEEIRNMIEESKNIPKFDIICMDYTSLYANVVPIINPRFYRNERRKVNIRKVYKPS